MARDCASCTAPGLGPELDRQLKAGVPLTLVSSWASEKGVNISARALARHRRDHLALTTRPGRKPVAGRLLEAIVELGEEGLEDGSLRVSLKDALAAQKALDVRLKQKLGEEWQYKLVMALSGAVPQRPRLLEPLDVEREEQEAEFQALLDGGDATDAKAAVKRLSEASNG